ncbi:MAG: glycosyltransferase [Candidatus Omnitrophota bacterium]|jgi:spore maturation protein CgeB
MEKNKIFIIAPYCYGIDESISRAFGSLGFEPYLKSSKIGLKKSEMALFKLIKEFPFAKAVLNRGVRHFLGGKNDEYLDEIEKFRPDIILIIKGETVFPETLKKIKEKWNIPCVSYMWDCPFFSYSAGSADIYRKSNFEKGMHLYDHVFVYDPYYVEELKKRGLTGLSYLPLATDMRQYRNVEVSDDEKKELGYDIAFVGSPFPNRIEVLDSLRDFRLGVFGDGWRETFKNRTVPPYYKGTATGEKVLKIYSSAKIVLNIHDPEARLSVNTRTFDIPACGAFELSDYRPEIEKLFRPGEDMVCYRDIPELLKLAGHYLENPSERQRIAMNGQKKVASEHTWRHRVGAMVDVAREKGLLK